MGPNQTYTELTQVPWLSLQAGDVVNIHYRSTPYRTKFGLRAKGTAAAPVIINGVTDSNCNRPEISGADAVTAADAAAAGMASDMQGTALILIWRAPTDALATYKASNITIQNLKLTGAKLGNSFTDNSGAKQTYSKFASAIYARRVDYLTVENCEITDNSQGVFTNSVGAYESISSKVDYSSYITIRRNKIYGNGNSASMTEHNLYLQARRTLVEGNYIGQVVAGSYGFPLKDRSSGTVIRYNQIVSSLRAIDLVESEEEYTTMVSGDPLYPEAWVYGNLIINDASLSGGWSNRLVHWGYDNNAAKSRTTLHFYNNTVANRINLSNSGYVTMFHIGSGTSVSPNVDVRNNIFANYGTASFFFLTESGAVTLTGANFLPSTWGAAATQIGATGTANTSAASTITGSDPGLSSTYVPTSTSAVVNKGSSMPTTATSPASATNLQVTGQYLSTISAGTRSISGGAIDLGAFEYTP